MKAVTLLSGGLDSTTTLAVAQQEGYAQTAILFRYGQRHVREYQAALAVAEFYHVPVVEVDFDLRKWGGSALTADVAVPQDRGLAEMSWEIPVTYVPARNMIFLSFATSLAEVLGVDHVFGGWNAIDFSGYPDCRKEFLDAFERVMNVGTKAAAQDGRTFHIHAPLLMLGKSAIIKLGVRLGAPYHLTWSCYAGGERACGRCDSCQLRLAGFGEIGLVDPINYADR